MMSGRCCRLFVGLGVVILLGSSCGKPGTASPANRSEESVADAKNPRPGPDAVPASSRPRLKREKGPVPLHEVSATESWSSAGRAQASGVPVPVRPANRAFGLTSLADQAMAVLAGVNTAAGALTGQQVAALNAALQQLRSQGAAAIPAIERFFEQNEEIDFDALAGGDQVEYGSLRLGLIDVLGQIGGPEATAAELRLLAGTADPLEIALLTRQLEQESPGQYREAELTAAREALQQAMQSGWRGGDVSALFETMQAVGDASVVAPLKDAVNRWNYYATLALAGLPDGAGISELIDLAQDPATRAMGTGDYALRPLAQVAWLYPDATRALVDQAQLNQIPDSAWPTVIASLEGGYIQYGNQIFGPTTAAPVWSEQNIRQRLGVLNDLLTVTTNATARQSLQNAIANLTTRLTLTPPSNG